MDRPADIIYVIHGTNVHEWWYRLLFGSRRWWKPDSPFSDAVRRGFGRQCDIRTHEWTGKNRHRDRIAAADALAERIKLECRPDDRIHLLGHSHGGNVALLAANFLDTQSIDSIILLANPNIGLVYPAAQNCDSRLELGRENLGGCGGKARHSLYWGQAAQKAGVIWNLYSPYDVVQSPLAKLLSGVPRPRPALSVVRIGDESTPKTVRNGRVPYRRLDAHSVMRSPDMGFLAGQLMQGADFDEIMKFEPAPYEIGHAGDIGVLLIHGFTASATETRPLADYISHRQPDWYCKGILLPGHGTTVQALENSNRHQWLHAVENAYLELTKTCSHIFLVGVSMGAVLCCHVAHKYAAAGSKVRGVVLMAPAFGFKPSTLLGIKLLKPLLRYVGKGSRKARYYADRRLFSYLKIPLARVGDVAQLGHEAFQQLEGLENIPVLMFAGKKEKTVSLDLIRKAHEMNRWIRFHELPGSEHILTVEPDREELFEKSLAFMQAQIEKYNASVATPATTIS
jgi:carboxylesterase